MKRKDRNLATQKPTNVKEQAILTIKTAAFSSLARRRKDVFRAVSAFLDVFFNRKILFKSFLDFVVKIAFFVALFGARGSAFAADDWTTLGELTGLRSDVFLSTNREENAYFSDFYRCDDRIIDADFQVIESSKNSVLKNWPSSVVDGGKLAENIDFNERPRFDFLETTERKRGYGALDEDWRKPISASSAPTIRAANLSNFAIDPFRGRFFGYVDGAWGTQYEQSGNPFEAGFNVGAFGGGFGQDWKLGENVVGGYGFQGRRLELDPSADMYDAKVDSFAGFLHISVYGPLWRLDLAVGASKNWNEQTRTLDFGGSNGDFNVLKNKFSSTQWNYEAEFGVRFDKGYTRIEPLVNFRVLTLQEPQDAEKLLTSVLRPSDFSDASFRLKLGSRFSWEYATRFSTLKPFLVASWAHEFGSRSIYTIGENTPYPVAYRYGKHRMARDRLNLGGGVDAALRDSVDLFFQYDVEIAAEYADYLFFAGFNKKY